MRCMSLVLGLDYDAFISCARVSSTFTLRIWAYINSEQDSFNSKNTSNIKKMVEIS